MHGYCAAPCVDIPLGINTAKQWLRTFCERNSQAGIYDQAALKLECANIQKAFPQPLSLVKNPFDYAVRMVRHAIVTVCRGAGPMGKMVENKGRSWARHIRIFLGKG